MTIQLSKYEARKQRGIAEYKWRKKQKAHYENLVVLLDGFAVALGFLFVMALIKGDTSLITLGFISLALATASLWGQTLNDKAHSFFYSDTPKMFMPKVFDFLEKLRYSKSEGNSSERRNEMKYVIRRAVFGLIALPLVAGAYVFGYLVLASLANNNPLTLDEIWNNGLLIGSVSAVAFAFATQIDRFVSKVVA
jgi:hypothetical protein